MSEFAFAVGSPERVQSSIWKLKCHRSDVYLMTRMLGRWTKVSLHSGSGHAWRIAHTTESNVRNASRDRVIYKWQPADDVYPGWKESIEILVPPLDPIDPIVMTEHQRVIRWAEPPTHGQKVLFKVYFQREFSEISNYLWFRSENVLGSLSLANGQVAWLTYRYEDLTPTELSQIQDHRDKVLIHLKPGAPRDVVTFAVLQEVIPRQPQPQLLDIALGYRNVATLEV